MKRLLAVLLWSVIAAAFIGPGTVTTAAAAGASHGLALLWALVFSTLATLVLQEAAARLTVVSGRDLARALRQRSAGGWGLLTLLVVLGAVVVGCAAYEAGNILGAVAGAAMALPLSAAWLTVLTGGVAAALLALGNPRLVARVLSALVAVMGIAFLLTAVRLEPSAAAVVQGSLLPSFPVGSGLLVLGLVGTTVVPYNLFLGSGLAAGQTLPELRFGLTVAVGLGGLISMGVLVVGTAVAGDFSFAALAAVLGDRLGPWTVGLFAAGLAAAGLTSAVTAPLAAAITAAGLFGGDDEKAVDAPEADRWAPRSWRFRSVWLAVLGVGLVFGLTDVKPIPVILLAQALNGVLLPWVAVFLLLAVNDRQLMGEAVNGWVSNLGMVGVVGVTLVLGVRNVVRAGAGVLGVGVVGEGWLLGVTGVVGLALGAGVLAAVRRGRA